MSGTAAPGPQLNFNAAAILIVDDEPFYAGLVERMLLAAGYTNIRTTSEPRDVERLHRESDFDLILLDIHMPHMSGIEVIERLRAIERHNYVPVIVMTGDGDMDTRLTALAKGARDFLVKPPRKEELLSRIRNLLEVRLLARENDSERNRFQRLLHDILPSYVVERLNRGETEIVDSRDDVAVMFADLVGFSGICARLDARLIVADLNRIFTMVDGLALSHGVEKIKTVGDAYLAVSGLTGGAHFAPMADFALAVVRELAALRTQLAYPYEIRIGIERGPLIVGVLKGHRSVFDIWGDTVNAAARLQAASTPGRVTVSRAFADAVMTDFQLELRGAMDLRGVGNTETLFLLDRILPVAP